MSLIGEPGLKRGDNIIIKINVCDARTADTGTITHPLFLNALLRYLRETFEDLNIMVVESDATVVIADLFVKWYGYMPVLEKWNAKYVNLSKCGTILKSINGRHLKELNVPSVFQNSDFFITVPKPKVNPISTITCCLKNQFGCLPVVEKNIYHPFLDEVIADANLAMKPDLCIVDGIIGQGGCQSPAYGVPIPLNLVICSRDPVAVDSLVAKMIGFNPWFIGHIRNAARSGIGSMKYNLLGDEIKFRDIDFEVDKIEFWLLKFASFIQKRAQKSFRHSERK